MRGLKPTEHCTKNLKIFKTFPKTHFDSRNFSTFPWKVYLAHSYFAVLKISQTSILLGQKSLHLPHLRHISRYFSIFLFNFKSPFRTPSSITNFPRETAQSLPVILYTGQTDWQSPHLEHLFISSAKSSSFFII